MPRPPQWIRIAIAVGPDDQHMTNVDTHAFKHPYTPESVFKALDWTHERIQHVAGRYKPNAEQPPPGEDDVRSDAEPAPAADDASGGESGENKPNDAPPADASSPP